MISPESGEAITLEDEIGSMIQDGKGGLVVILGGPGSGKTTALRHLDAILPPWTRGRVRLLEEPDLEAIASAGPEPLVILAHRGHVVPGPGREKAVIRHDKKLAALAEALGSTGSESGFYRLAPWDQDDAIEYLLATDRDACASVMTRLGRSGEFPFLEGIPELCSLVLDRMARDPAIEDVRAALRRELEARIEPGSALKRRVEDLVIDCLHDDRRPWSEGPFAGFLMTLWMIGASPAFSFLTTLWGIATGDLARHGDFLRLIRHRPAALLLAAGRIAADIESGEMTRALAHHYPREVMLEIARSIAGRAAAIQNLVESINGVRVNIHPLAASLLHAAAPGWRPDPGCRPRLVGAYLNGVAWPGLDLAGIDLGGADLWEADLREAILVAAHATRTCLRGANLQRAILHDWLATEADLSRCDLTEARARQAQFRKANLASAILAGADLWKAELEEARIDGADFTGARLEDAHLRGLPLRRARLGGARFGGADLRGCDLEGVDLPEADFHDANLGLAILTGSRMPGANFVGADLRDAKLAEIDWPGACLRDANLRGANFHLGSTRSGMLDSPIACEGSRTGFYTDDFLDRDIKPAEEIRKANLRGADLRGADIRDVDFYLVNLRDARYTAEQAEHLRRCRAILDAT